MDKFFANLPKNILALLLVGGGIFLIVLFDPPHTLCDAQMTTLKEAQKGFLYLDPKDKLKKTTDFEVYINQCKASNSPGGCYELFARMKTLLNDLDGLSKECSGKASGDRNVKRVIWESLDLLVRLAWGQKPPETYYEKFGWLEPPDLLIYCRLKKATETFFTTANWEQFREKMFKDLPGIDGLQRSKAWEMMLLSTNCDQYR